MVKIVKINHKKNKLNKNTSRMMKNNKMEKKMMILKLICKNFNSQEIFGKDLINSIEKR